MWINESDAVFVWAAQTLCVVIGSTPLCAVNLIGRVSPAAFILLSLICCNNCLRISSVSSTDDRLTWTWEAIGVGSEIFQIQSNILMSEYLFLQRVTPHWNVKWTRIGSPVLSADWTNRCWVSRSRIAYRLNIFTSPYNQRCNEVR